MHAYNIYIYIYIFFFFISEVQYANFLLMQEILLISILIKMVGFNINFIDLALNNQYISVNGLQF